MFGYIRTDRPELKIKDDNAYKAVYCSVCKETGKRYNVFLRLFLSYDSAFLASMLMALSEEKICLNRKRCVANPLKKCNMCDGGKREITYAADVSVILLYYKIKDNIGDSTFFKALLYRIILLLVIGSFKKAVKLCPDAAKIVFEYAQEQKKIEDENCMSPDRAADPTGKMLSSILLLGSENYKGSREALSRLGYFLGRWVYLIDAFDDMEKDKKRDCYNPYLNSGENCEDIKGDLFATVYQAERAYCLSDIKKFRGITENVINKGLFAQTTIVYEKKKKASNDN